MYHMNRIEIDLDDVELLVQMECTSLQLMRQPIVLHAKGFFDIDYRTLTKVRLLEIFLNRYYTTFLSFTATWRHRNVHDLLCAVLTKIPKKYVKKENDERECSPMAAYVLHF